jgi:hypothetical protein
MARYYDIDAANATLPDVERILLDLRDQRAELIRLRDAVLAASGHAGQETSSRRRRTPPPGDGDVDDIHDEPPTDERALHLRMQGLIDQMQAGVTRLVERDVTLREIETGLIDFPALANGRPIWLCWRLGEGPIEWWHEHDTGFSGRQRLLDLT